MFHKIRIVNGLIYNSKEKNFFEGEVEITGDKISYVGALRPHIEKNEKDINAKGNIVAPGFVDIHSHEDDLEKSKGYVVAEDMLRMGVTTCVAGNCGTMFQSLQEFCLNINERGCPTNYVMYSGCNYHRAALGIDIYEACSDEQLKELAKKIQRDLDSGAIGISFGLEYAPGMLAEEIIKLCSLVEKKDLKLAAHMRDDKENSIPSIKELIYIAEKTGLPVFISHIGSFAAYGQMKEAYKLIEDALAKGIKVFVDCYPYNAFCTPIGCALFDEEALEQKKFKFEDLLFATGPYSGRYCNKDLYEKARKDFPMSFVIGFGINEDEVRYSISHPLTMIGSDGFVIGEQGHPRTAGTFPRVLGKYVREEKIMTLEEALYKMTYMPAKAVGLTRKGFLQEGNDADIVIFNKEKIIDRADFQHVNKFPEGITHVIVNGRIACKNNNIAAPYNGRFIEKR